MSLPIVNAFSVDVEDYFQVAALAPAVARDSWSARESRVERNTEVLLELLAERSVRGTFFVLGWIAQHHPRLVQRIADQGHEIASHGYSHQLIYTQTPREFREETRCAKDLLEELTGQPVTGYRAASFSITERSLWALDVLVELGFLYDSSVFPIRHDRYGIPGARAEPGPVRAPAGGSIVEFPLTVASCLGVRVPVSGGGYFRLLPYAVTRRGLRQINQRAGRPFVFYVHPWEVDPAQPRIRVGAFSRFRHYTNLDRCATRLRRLLSEFQFAPVRAVLQSRGLLPSPAPAAPQLAAQSS